MISFHLFIFSHFRTKSHRSYSTTLHFSTFGLTYESDDTIKLYPLSAYKPMELSVLFVYGRDFQRGTDIFIMPEAVRELYLTLVLFMILAILILYFIRKWFRMRRSSAISTFIDIFISFIGGGNLQIQHKWERWFFGILLTGVFFISAICTDNLLCFVYYQYDQKIDTFQKLAKVESPIYLFPQLKNHHTNVLEMLR